MSTLALLPILEIVGLGVAMVAAAPAAAQPAPAAPPAPLRVIGFDGGHNLAIWAAQRQGFFEQQGLAVQLSYTPGSGALVAGLMQGRQDIALTGFAFVLRELIQRAGLGPSEVTLVSAGGTPNRYRELVAGKHDGTLLRTPYELLAKDRGLHLLVADVGPYLGTVCAARRSWARDHDAALVGFIRGYLAGLAWAADPKNREIAEAILVAQLRDMTPALARRSYDDLFAAHAGLVRDGALDPARVRTVLGLRSKFGEPKKTLDDPAKYVDAGYRDRALAAPISPP